MTTETSLIEIPILCDYTLLVHPTDLRDIQDTLKTKKELEKLVLSVKKFGWLFPIFVWADIKNQHYKIVNGAHRLKAYYMLEKDGFYLKDGLPVIEIQAKDFGEAKENLLRASSTYSKVVREGFDALSRDLTQDQLSELLDVLPKADYKFLSSIDDGDMDEMEPEKKSVKYSDDDDDFDYKGTSENYQNYILSFPDKKSFDTFWRKMEQVRNDNYPDLDYKDVLLALLKKYAKVK